jgi:hypothetical protein
MSLLWVGIIGIIFALILNYLKHSFVKQWVNNVFHWEPERWFNIASFILIHVASAVSLYAIITTYNSKQSAEEKLTLMTHEQQKSSEALHQLEREQAFRAMVNRAEQYEADPFFELLNIAAMNSNLSDFAKRVIDNIQYRLDRDRVEGLGVVERVLQDRNEKPDFNQQIPTEDIVMALEAGQKESAANVIRRERIKSLVPYLVDSAKTEKNLWVNNRITYAISVLSGMNFFPWNINELEEWWVKSEKDYPRFPYEAFNRGQSDLYMGRTKDAQEEFKEVIKSDKGADISRAHAVICSVLLGELEEAKRLASSFKYRNGAWEELAHATIMLAEGDRDASTTKLINASQRNERILLLIRTGENTLWKDMDWQRYNQEVKWP